jgi:hypothetical protein
MASQAPFHNASLGPEATSSFSVDEKHTKKVSDFKYVRNNLFHSKKNSHDGAQMRDLCKLQHLSVLKSYSKKENARQ